MESPEDERFANVESQSVRSSQSQIDAANDLMKIVEENYQRFVDIVNHSAPVNNNLEKELAKEDKKCTFLQYKIENLQKRYYDAKQISTTLQRSVREQQMEIEKVSAVIFEQLRQLDAKFPPDGLSHYSDVVSVIISAGEWVKNLKDVLERDIEECVKKTVELDRQRLTIILLIDQIRNSIVEKSGFEESLKLPTRSIAKPDFDSFKTHLSLLNEKFNEYRNLKRADDARKVDLEELEKKKDESLNKYREMNRALFGLSCKYIEVYKSFRKESGELRKEQVEFENLYNRMLNDFDSMLNPSNRDIEKLDYDIYARQQDFDRLATMKQSKKSEYRVILSQIEQLKLNCSNAEKHITSCREQEKMSRNVMEIVLEQIDILKTINAVRKSLLDELIRKAGALGQEYTSSIIGLEDFSVENLEDKINQEQTEADRTLTNNQKLDVEILELKNIVSNSTETYNKLKNDIKLCRIKSNFLEQFLEKLEAEYNETREKQLAAVHREMTQILKDVTNAYSSVFEKQLLIDSVQDDIYEYTKLLSEMQQKLWDVKNRNEILHNELAQLQKTVFRENEAIESKKKLLDDLEKNSFPRNKIPVNWFKSFEKQKQEYDTLVKQRLELEKQRNKLIIEIDSQAFQESKCESVGSPKSSSSMKRCMFDIFKERVRKRKSSNLRA